MRQITKRVGCWTAIAFLFTPLLGQVDLNDAVLLALNWTEVERYAIADCSGFPRIAAAGRFNHDDIEDLIVVHGGCGISVLLGKGNREFEPFVHTPDQTFGITRLAIADLNHDGLDDLVIPKQTMPLVHVWISRGDGSFRPFDAYATGINPLAVVVTDFNEDGDPDLAVPNRTLPGFTSIYLGRGDGTFDDPVNWADHGNDIATGDFDGDGHADFVVNPLFTLPQGFLVTYGRGNGTFDPSLEVDLGGFTASFRVADFDRDGRDDLLIVPFIPGAFEPELWVLLSDGRKFTRHVVDSVAESFTYNVGDVDGDGLVDIVGVTGSAYTVRLGNGDGTFRPVFGIPRLITSGIPTIADVDGDGLPDLVTHARTLGTLVERQAAVIYQDESSSLPEFAPFLQDRGP